MANNISELVKPPKYQGIDSLENNCVIIRISLSCRPADKNAARRAMLREIKLLFDRERVNNPV